MTNRPLVFLWENFGPYHFDRLEVLAKGGRPVVGIEFAGTSELYGWQRTAAPSVDMRTLRTIAARRKRLHLAWLLVRECVRLRRGDIFLCHYEQWPVLAAAIVLRLMGRPAFAMIESKFDDYPRRLGVEVIKKLFLLPYRGVLTPTLRSRDYMRFLGFRLDQIALGYSTLSIDRIAALSGAPPAPEGVSFEERDFVIVARLVPKKNIAMGLSAFALWRRQAGRSRDLHILGSGPLEDDLRAQATSLGIGDHVHFHGFVQTDAVSRQLGQSLCLILPSIEEQFGLVVIEAQAAGLPVLAARNVGACDVLIDSGINGFVLDPNNPESCAALMLVLSEDEATWRRFAIAARAGCDRGDVARFAEGVATLTGARPRDPAMTARIA